MKIALVDDERIYLDEITRICREFAAENDIETEISAFSDGESFLSSLDGTGCGMVFMDIFMDGIDGVETVKKLRRRDSGCIVIFLTSCGERMPEAFSCHAFEYILKPFDDKRVKDVLADALKLLPASKYIDVCSRAHTAFRHRLRGERRSLSPYRPCGRNRAAVQNDRRRICRADRRRRTVHFRKQGHNRERRNGDGLRQQLLSAGKRRAFPDTRPRAACR